MYEIVVANAPNNLGNYEARVTLAGETLEGSFAFSSIREEAIEKCRQFIEWHKNYDPSTQTIPA